MTLLFFVNAQIECVTTVVSENDTHKFVCESTANFLMCVAMISQGRVWAGSTFSSGEFFCAPLPPSYDLLTAGFLPFRLVESHLPFFFRAHFSKISSVGTTPFGAPRTRPETHPSA